MVDSVVGVARVAGLFPAGCRVLVGVSGGADSVALLHLLHVLCGSEGMALTVAHLHHGLRGDAAEEDLQFVRQLAWKLGRPCLADRVDVPALARERKISIEMAAREARYDFFRRAAAEAGADRVALAHHADDQAETILLRLLRGAGGAGLGGMAPLAVVRGLTLVRPLLGVSRAALRGFLRAHGLRWREDATNADTALLRNRVRAELVPLLEARFQPALREVLGRTAELLRDDEAALADLASCAADRARTPSGDLAWAVLSGLPIAVRRRVLLGWLRAGGVPESRIDVSLVRRVEALPVQGRLALPGGSTVFRVGARLVLEAKGRTTASFEAALAVPGEVVWPEAGCIISARRGRGIARGPWSATISPERLAGRALAVRSWRPGDAFRPWGMEGTVKLQDVWVDRKVPRAERGLQPVIACGSEIVWVPGYRIAAAWALAGSRSPCVRLAFRRIGLLSADPIPLGAKTDGDVG